MARAHSQAKMEHIDAGMTEANDTQWGGQEDVPATNIAGGQWETAGGEAPAGSGGSKYTDSTVSELKELLKERSVSSSGLKRKQDFIDALESHDQSGEGGTNGGMMDANSTEPRCSTCGYRGCDWHDRMHPFVCKPDSMIHEVLPPNPNLAHNSNPSCNPNLHSNPRNLALSWRCRTWSLISISDAEYPHRNPLMNLANTS